MNDSTGAPLTLVMETTFGAWRGDVTGVQCAITGERSFCFDTYCTTSGESLPVSANASRKIQNFIRRREAARLSGPLEFVIYGRRVHVEDRRRSLGYSDGGAVVSG